VEGHLLGEVERVPWEVALADYGGNVADAAMACGLADMPQGTKALWGRSAAKAWATYRRWQKHGTLRTAKEFAMAKDITMTTSRATLGALGEYLQRHGFFAPVRAQVQIPQKTVRYRPSDKVLDGLLGMLCGAKTISQSNGTICLDPAVQRACGRTGCAEQSTIARTLQASTAETVDQRSRVSWYYLKRYGQTPHHLSPRPSL
jgi:hypothetical protein